MTKEILIKILEEHGYEKESETFNYKNHSVVVTSMYVYCYIRKSRNDNDPFVLSFDMKRIKTITDRSNYNLLIITLDNYAKFGLKAKCKPALNDIELYERKVI